MGSLSRKHVLITGASRGVGAAAATLFAERGSRLSLFSRSFDEQSALILSDAVKIFRGDLTKRTDVEAAVSQFEASFGAVDILVNNAGFGRYEPFAESAPDDLEQTIATNFTGLVLLSRLVIPKMIERRSGLLIHVGSDLGRRPLANMAVYAATKHAVVGFSQSLARELSPHGIRSSVVLPGLIDSHFGGRSVGDVSAESSLTCEEVARAVLYIAESPDSMLFDEVSFRSKMQEI